MKTLTGKKLNRIVWARVSSMVPTLMLAFFLPAGTLRYWQAWVYIVIIYLVSLLLISYLLKNDPDLVRRRMQMKEKRIQQKAVIKFSILFFTLSFLLPGFDQRFGWSRVPVWLVIAADILLFLSYYLVFLTMRENSYAGRTVIVEEGQKVIDTGPYHWVRHPMYVGVILLLLATPLALDSWWALIPAALIIPTIVIRILDEENTLSSELSGYDDYRQSVRFRLIPGIW
jgi:protein-S-isoprenylcysteine O-methyltransferase Ste14